VPDYFAGLTDIGMTLDGDIMVGDNGDFLLVEGFEWLYREVNKRLRTENPEWMFHPTIGVSLSDFQGYPNTPEAAKELRQRIKYVLSKDNIAFPGEFNVRVVPVERDAIIVYIYLDMAGNRTELEKLIYDYSNGIVQPIESNDTTYTPIPAEKKLIDNTYTKPPVTPNKYQAVIDNQLHNTI